VRPKRVEPKRRRADAPLRKFLGSILTIFSKVQSRIEKTNFAGKFAVVSHMLGIEADKLITQRGFGGRQLFEEFARRVLPAPRTF
jgi:hypothetical protein